MSDISPENKLNIQRQEMLGRIFGAAAFLLTGLACCAGVGYFSHLPPDSYYALLADISKVSPIPGYFVGIETFRWESGIIVERPCTKGLGNVYSFVQQLNIGGMRETSLASGCR